MNKTNYMNFDNFINVVPMENSKSSIGWSVMFGLMNLESQNPEVVYKRLAEYNYRDKYFTIFPISIKDNIVKCKIVSRKASISSPEDGIKFLYPHPDNNKSYVTELWLQNNIESTIKFANDNLPTPIALSRVFGLDKSVREILRYYNPEYEWIESSYSDPSIVKYVEDAVYKRIITYLSMEPGQLNEALTTDISEPYTSLTRILNATQCATLKYNAAYTDTKKPFIVARYRITGFKKHFDVVKDIIAHSSADNVVYINKIENRGNKSIVEVVEILPLPIYDNYLMRSKTVQDIENNLSYIKYIPVKDDDYVLEKDFRLIDNTKVEFNVTGIDQYQFDNGYNILNVDEIFEKEQDFMQAVLNYVKKYIDINSYGEASDRFDLVFKYEEVVENGELATIVTNMTPASLDTRFNAVMDYIKSYKTIFKLDGTMKEIVTTKDEFSLDEETNLISYMQEVMKMIGRAPLANINLDRDSRYHLLHGLVSARSGLLMTFGEQSKPAMFSKIIKTDIGTRPDFDGKTETALKEQLSEVIFDGYLKVVKSDVEYIRIK